MEKVKRGMRYILSWLLAAMAAFFVCNLVVFFYHCPAGWIDRHSSATNAIWEPHATLRMGTEGHGVYTVDKRGYLNEDLPLADSYTVVVGSSYVQGKEVAMGKRFTDLLNRAVSSGEALHVYNVSQDGFYYPEIVKCFPALLQEFPAAKTIVIELGSTNFSADELTAALEQCDFDAEQTG